MADLVHQAPPVAGALDASAAAGQDTFRKRALMVIARRYTSVETRRAYARDLDDWLDHCASRGVNPFTCTPVEAALFRELSLTGRQPSSVFRSMAALSAIYKGLRQELPNLVNVFDGRFTARPSSRAVNPRPQVLPEVAEKIIRACLEDTADPWAGARDAAIIGVCWGTGVRRSAVVNLDLTDWSEALGPDGQKEGVIRVLLKGEDRKNLRVPETVANLVRSWLPRRLAGPALFQDVGGARLSSYQVYGLLKRRGKDAGVSTKGLMPHGFRAGFITRAYDQHLPEHMIQEAATHALAETTRGYDRGERGAEVARTVGELPGKLRRK